MLDDNDNLKKTKTKSHMVMAVFLVLW